MDLPQSPGGLGAEARKLRRAEGPKEVGAIGGEGGKEPLQGPGLGLALRGEGEVRPAQKSSLSVPEGLAVAHQPELHGVSLTLAPEAGG